MSTKKIKPILKNKHIEDETIIEIGVDEAGRGPMLGRVYSAAVINTNFNYCFIFYMFIF
jgi:ribonuclease HIII